MSSSDSMRRAALTLLFALSIGLFTVTAGEAVTSYSPDGDSQPQWLPPEGQGDSGCGSDGDPDNPTVDQPQTRGNGEWVGGGVEVYSPKRSSRALWEVWLTRLLQLMGIR